MAEDRRLESLLNGLASELDWPPTPDLRSAVARRTAGRRRPGLPILLLAAALAATLAGAAAVQAYRGLQGASVSRVPAISSARPPTPSAPSPPSGVAASLALGTRYGSVDEAAAAAGFTPLVPTALGSPDEVYFRPEGRIVTLLYHPRPDLPANSEAAVGALVMEAPAALPDPPFVKAVGRQTSVRPVTVNGGAGYWISGAPHAYFFYRDGLDDRFRLAGDVLIWDQGRLVVRIESSLSESQAMAAAGSVR
jgi:hypothetical protein